jgi:hypothetical protein
MSLPLSIILSAAPSGHRVDQAVAVSIEVRNISQKPLRIVGVLEGSEMGVRFPHYIPAIKAPVKYEPEMEAYGNVAPLRAVDFRLLLPQESFDPTKPLDDAAYLPLFLFRNFRPPAPGVYELSLTLSTESERDEQWIGIRGYPGEEKALELLKDVPRLKIRSNTLLLNVEA